MYALDVDSLKQKLECIKSNKGQYLLLELTFQEAVETDSTILHHCYAYYVFHNLENKTLDDIQREKIIKIISELNEYEIIHLLNFLFPSFMGNTSDFFERYEAVLMRRPNYIGSPEEDVEFNAFFNQYRTTLEQKGLIVGVPQVKNGTMNFDDKKYSITPFGEIVANAIYDDDFFGKNENVDDE